MLGRASALAAKSSVVLVSRISSQYRNNDIFEAAQEDSSFDDEDGDCLGDEMEEGVAQGALHAHRCSMIKKYSTTFFTPAKSKKQMP